MKQSKTKNIKNYVLLHIIFLIYSLSAVCSKYAATYEFLSVPFIFFYGIVLLIMGVYAILWQQILKKLPLTVAFANKAVTIIWGIVWGVLFFGDKVSISQVIGAVIIIAGVLLVVTDKNE